MQLLRAGVDPDNIYWAVGVSGSTGTNTRNGWRLLKQELAGYDKDLDFLEFIFDKGREFEAGILRLFQDQFVVATVAQDYREISSLDKAEETFEAMKQGLPIIYQAVLWDAHNMTYGSPDFLNQS